MAPSPGCCPLGFPLLSASAQLADSPPPPRTPGQGRPLASGPHLACVIPVRCAAVLSSSRCSEHMIKGKLGVQQVCGLEAIAMPLIQIM